MTMNPLLTNNELEIIEFLIDEKQSGWQHIQRPLCHQCGQGSGNNPHAPGNGHAGNARSRLMGSFNLRGRVMPLLNLATWLGKEDDRLVERQGAGDRILRREVRFPGIFRNQHPPPGLGSH